MNRGQESIAEFIAEVKGKYPLSSDKPLDELAENLAEYFKGQNEQFDKETFLKVAEHSDYTEE